ncbi:acyl transferase/acyl hydrolase/lysophospholipase [Globomyces pollinis-pini]|nr:acyl transferase/acyl hydrolase/lysophospholipase [Globomyces pollinis-pini]
MAAQMIHSKKKHRNSIWSNSVELLHLVLNITSDVSRFYGDRLYRKIIANRNQLSYYTFIQSKAVGYEQWKSAGYMCDKYSGLDLWKHKEECKDYDFQLLKEQLMTLKRLEEAGDIHEIMLYLRSSLSRNMADMGNPKLYEKLHAGTKDLIEEYIYQVIKLLNIIADSDSPDLNIDAKLTFFKHTLKSFGRTALLLSGGGTFGLVHGGSVKVLYEQGLLPRIITGSSAGSIVAAYVGTRTDEELHVLLDQKIANMHYLERNYEIGNPWVKLVRFIKSRVVLDHDILSDCIRDNIGDITFAEAYKKTRRILNITVSSSTDYEMPRLLNYITAPNVLIRSAVTASSAIPFVFRSVPLLAKDAHKNIIPWNRAGHHCIDGSFEGDLPMQRIRELFGVNHFCVVQTNPHILPYLNTSPTQNTKLTEFIRFLASEFRSEFEHRVLQFFEMGYHSSSLTKGLSMLCQKYVGDITIVPYLPWSMFQYVMCTPHITIADDFLRRGEIATYPHITLMKNRCEIEMCLQQNILKLREQMVLVDQIKPDPVEKLFQWNSFSLLPSQETKKVLDQQSSMDTIVEEEDGVLPMDPDVPFVKLVRNHQSAESFLNSFSILAK